MKRIICLMLVFVVGCAGANSKPVAIHQQSDEYKNCASLKMEIESIDMKIAIRKDIKKAKGISNLIKLASSYSLIVPWLFVDLKNAEQIEIEALQQRRKVVLILIAEKNCNQNKFRKVGAK